MANNNKFNGAKTNAKMDELTAIEKSPELTEYIIRTKIQPHKTWLRFALIPTKTPQRPTPRENNRVGDRKNARGEYTPGDRPKTIDRVRLGARPCRTMERLGRKRYGGNITSRIAL